MSFLNPWFFLGTLTALGPLLIHMVKRERAEKVLFPTLMFLRRVSKKTIRYQQVRQILLLLLRILALLFLTFAFARPYFPQTGALAAMGTVPTEHIILVDNSLSMGYGGRWERGKDAAVEIVRSARPSDQFALVAFSDTTPILMDPSRDRDAVLFQLEKQLALSDRATDFVRALGTVEQIGSNGETSKRVLHLISDFQKNGVGPEASAFQLRPGIELQCYDVGSEDFSNLTLADVRVIEGEEIAGNKVKIKASILNYGNKDRQNVRVSMLLDSRHIAEQRADVAKGGNQGLEFLTPGFGAGPHQMVLEVEDPQFTGDNRYRLIVEARGKTRVVAIEEPGSGCGGRSPSLFLSHALNIPLLSQYQLITLPVQKAQSGDFPPAKLWIWNNAHGGSSLQQRLEQFVRNGGGLAVIAGDSSLAADFNRTFGSWLPVKAREDSVGSDSSRRRNPYDDFLLLTNLRLDHPIFQPFRDPHSGSFTTAKFFAHARLEVAGETQVLARFDNGDPAVVSLELDRGHVLVLAFSADDAGNDLPLKPVFAPFWQQLLHHLEHYHEARHALEVGEAIEPQKLIEEASARRGKTGEDSPSAAAVLDPAKQRLPIQPGTGSVMLEKAGFYEIRSSDLRMNVAVNSITRESDLAHGNAEELSAAWKASKTPVIQPTAEDDSRPTEEEKARTQAVWQYLLLSVLVFLLAEGVIGNRSSASSNSRQ